jgi:teichoic acid transport system permease protein
MTAETPAQRRRRVREDDFTAVRHVYEPHRVGLPPAGSYLRELWRRREFAFELSRTNLRVQHFNTAFGQLWLVLNPLLLAGVYFILVDILRSGQRPEGYFAHLVVGIFAYYFISQSLQHGIRSVVSGGRLILNTAFPRALLPLSSVLNAFLRFLPTVIIYIPIHIAADRPFTVHMLWAIPLVGLMILIAAGLTMLVAAGQVYFRDLRNFLPYMTRVWLYATPILYFAYEVPERYEFLITLNPIGRLFTAWSDVIVLGVAPQASDLAIATAWALAIFAAGTLFFMSREREFAVRL